MHSSQINSTISVRLSLGPTEKNTQKNVCLVSLHRCKWGYLSVCDHMQDECPTLYCWFHLVWWKWLMHLVFPNYTVKSEDGEKAALAQAGLWIPTITQIFLFSSATPIWPPWLLWNIACNAKILEAQAELRVETWCDTGIIRQKFLSGVMVGSTTQHSVFCTVFGSVAVTQLLWTLFQLVQLVDTAMLTVRLQVWETLKIQLPSHEVEETHKKYTRM